MKSNMLLFLAGLIIICLGIYDLRDAYRSSDVSEPAEAVISSWKVNSASTGHRRWFRLTRIPGRRTGGGIDFQISYVFSVNGQNYNGNDIVRTAPASNVVTVLYNPNNPTQNKIKKPVRITGWFLLGLGILFVTVSGAINPWQRKGRPDRQ